MTHGQADLVPSTSEGPAPLRSEAGVGGVSPSVAALRSNFSSSIERHFVSSGQTVVFVRRDRSYEVLAWLKNTPGQEFNYLTDVTAVDYRDPERPLELVYQLRSLGRKADLRIKVALDKEAPLEVRSVCDLWRGADWLEREVYDMFGVTFVGHPDLRRILMWETYAEGYPLRKDFPLRGHFSRAEQTRQALAANPEAHYSLEELSIAETYGELPKEMQERLARGERGFLK
jgi:NADH-quinone oxidoreductase subunit C